MKALICGQYEMELPDTGGDNKWWFDWAVAAPGHAGDHLTVSLKTFDALRRVFASNAFFTVWEPFAGIGAHALMLQDIFDPGHHIVCDYAPEAVAHLEKVLPEWVDVIKQDAYAPTVGRPHADLAVMDYGDMTVFQAQPGKQRGDLLEKAVATHPKAFTITDIAARYLHLQRKSYEPILGPGACDSYEEYLDRYAEHIETRFGYTFVEGNYTRWSCVMAFAAPEANAPRGSFHKLEKGGTPGLVIQ